MAELRTQVYGKELQKQLHPDNSFYTKGSKHPDTLAASAEVVKIPQAGAVPGAQIGQPAQLPLPIKSVTDGGLDISVYPVIAPPVLVDNESEVTVNYNRRKEYQEQQAAEINNACADIAAVEWAPSTATFIKKTTGAARATNVTGLTGNRLALKLEDIAGVASLFRRFNLKPGDSIYGVLTEDAYLDIMKLQQFTDFEKAGNTKMLELGILGKIYGINIMSRNTSLNYMGLAYSNAATPVKRALRTIGATTDRPANLFFSEKSVTYVGGKIGADINGGPGLVGGKVLEAWTRFGAGKKREDQKGVVALLEDNEA